MKKQTQTTRTRETYAIILEKNLLRHLKDYLINKVILYYKHVCQVGSDPDKNCIKLVGPTCGVKQEVTT